MKNKWTYDKCYQRALQCSSRAEYYKKYEQAYNASNRHKWLDSFTWFTPTNILLKRKIKNKVQWSYDLCKSYAIQCKTKIEFKTKYYNAYDTALRKGWMNTFNWFIDGNVNKIKWTYDACKDVALTCKTKSDFYTKYRRAYTVSKENNWIKDYTWFITPLKNNTQKKIKWTYDVCKAEAEKYNTLTDFRKFSHRAYIASINHKYLPSFDWLKRNTYGYNKDYVYAYIFKKQHTVYIGRTINPAQRHQQHISGKTRSAVFTYASLHNISIPNMTILEKDITVIKGLELEDYYVSKYKQLNWNVLNTAPTGVLCGSMGLLRKKWTKGKCYKEAQKYKTIKEFKVNAPGAYQAALKNKWNYDYVWFKNKNKPHIILQYTKNNKFIRKYTNGVNEIIEELKLSESSKSNIYACCNGLQKTAYGYIWKYEENPRYKSKNQIPVKQFSLDHKFICQYDDISDAINNIDSHITRKMILDVCHKRRRSTGGFIWEYVDEQIYKKQTIVPVIQYSLDGQFIKKFKDIREAAIEIDSGTDAIKHVCDKHSKSLHGYIWRYENDN